MSTGKRATRDAPAADDPSRADASATDAAAPRRARLKPGERRVHILQTLAAMLETPQGEKITTAALAARIGVSEAALYRHFASKAQMFEGLIDFIDQTLFALINQILTREPNGVLQARAIALMLLNFAVKNPGMTRVLTCEALVGEHARLAARVNQIIDRIEASLRQCLRLALMEANAAAGENAVPLPPDYDPALRAGLVICYVSGCWHRYAQSGFKRAPGAQVDAQLRILLQ